MPSASLEEWAFSESAEESSSTSASLAGSAVAVMVAKLVYVGAMMGASVAEIHWMRGGGVRVGIRFCVGIEAIESEIKR